MPPHVNAVDSYVCSVHVAYMTFEALALSTKKQNKPGKLSRDGISLSFSMESEHRSKVLQPHFSIV